jgi:hypothetical protein
VNAGRAGAASRLPHRLGAALGFRSTSRWYDSAASSRSSVCPVGAVSITTKPIARPRDGARRRRGTRRSPRCRGCAGPPRAAPGRGVEAGAGGAQHLVGVARASRRGVDAGDLQAGGAAPLSRARPARHAPRVGGGEVHAWPRRASSLATRAATVVLPTPPLPMVMMTPRAARRELVDQRVEELAGEGIEVGGRGAVAAASIGAPSCRSAAMPTSPKGSSGTLDARQRAQRPRASRRARRGTAGGHRHRDGVVRVGRAEHAVETRAVADAERGELAAGALGLA